MNRKYNVEQTESSKKDHTLCDSIFVKLKMENLSMVVETGDRKKLGVRQLPKVSMLYCA